MGLSNRRSRSPAGQQRADAPKKVQPTTVENQRQSWRGWAAVSTQGRWSRPVLHNHACQRVQPEALPPPGRKDCRQGPYCGQNVDIDGQGKDVCEQLHAELLSGRFCRQQSWHDDQLRSVRKAWHTWQQLSPRWTACAHFASAWACTLWREGLTHTSAP